MSPGSGPFFFGATNAGHVGGVTRITARAYDPADKQDRWRIVQLASLPSIVSAFGPNAKFGVPAQVQLALGPESVLARADGRGNARLSFTGPVAHDFAHDLVRGQWSKGGARGTTQEIELMSRQVQQVGVKVIPKHDDGSLYAVHIGHELIAKGKKPVNLGGLTVIFAAPKAHW